MKISSSTSARFANMSFVCACLVVLIHTGFSPPEGTASWWVAQLFTHVGVTRIAVPFFFLAAGFFLAGRVGEEGWYKAALHKRLMSLALPYLLWNMLYLAYIEMLSWLAGMAGVAIHIPMPPLDTLTGWLSALGLIPWQKSALVHLWFVRCLFVFVLISPILVRLVRLRYVWAWLAFAFVLVGWIMTSVPYEGPAYMALRYQFSIEGLFCFAFGMALRLRDLNLVLPRWVGVLSLLVGIICFLGRPLFGVVLGGGMTWVGILTTMFGVWKVVPNERTWRVASYSFPIYLLHYFIGIALAGIVSAIGLREWANHESIWFYFVRAIIQIAASCIVIGLVRCRMPRVSNVLLGGR